MTWYSTFDAVFFTGIATMVFTCFAIVIKTALASKCDNLNLCFGCIQIHRRVELESDDSTIPITQTSLNVEKNNQEKNNEEKSEI